MAELASILTTVMSEASTVDQSGVVAEAEGVDQMGGIGEREKVDQTRTGGETEKTGTGDESEGVHVGQTGLKNVDQIVTGGETEKVDQNGGMAETERAEQNEGVGEGKKIDQTGAESGTGEGGQNGRVSETEKADQNEVVGERGKAGQNGTAEEIKTADQTGTVDQNGRVDKTRTAGSETALSGRGSGGEDGGIELQDMTQSTTQTPDPLEDTEHVIYEAELEQTHIERSKFTSCGLSCISVVLLIVLGVLFVSSFPFSLFVVLFCMDTKKACQPFKYITFNPWRLYLTRDCVCYHLPKPPHRPYINLLYWRRSPYHVFTIPLGDIADMVVEELGVDEEGTLKRGTKLLETGITVDYQSVVIELKPSAPSIDVPDYACFGFRPHFKPSHTLAIFSVKDAHTFVEEVKEQMATVA